VSGGRRVEEGVSERVEGVKGIGRTGHGERNYREGQKGIDETEHIDTKTGEWIGKVGREYIAYRERKSRQARSIGRVEWKQR